MSSQDPPKTIQTTGLLLLPPPSPPKSVTQALQELSTVARVDTGILVQTVGTPPIIVPQNEKKVEENKQKEEKEETQDKEKFAMFNLVELPKIGTPTKTLRC